jgi:hypothetical protein
MVLHPIEYNNKSNQIKSKQYETGVAYPAQHKMALPSDLQSSDTMYLNLRI